MLTTFCFPCIGLTPTSGSPTPETTARALDNGMQEFRRKRDKGNGGADWFLRVDCVCSVEFVLTRPVSSGKYMVVLWRSEREGDLTTAFISILRNFNKSVYRLSDRTALARNDLSTTVQSSRRYGMNICRQCFRERAAQIGFEKVRQEPISLLTYPCRIVQLIAATLLASSQH